MNLTKKYFVGILKNYEIGDYKSHEKLWWSIKNSLYQIKTTKGIFILKVFGSLEINKTAKVLGIIETLREQNVPIPKTFRTLSGKLILNLNKKHMIIQNFEKNEGKPKVNTDYARDLGRNLALVDSNLIKIESHGFPVKRGYQFKRATYRSTPMIEDFDFNSAEEKYLIEVKRIKKEKLRKSLIHGDFTSSNLIFKNKKIKFILDWDEMRNDYLASDAAIALSHMITFRKRVERSLISEFFKEYEKKIKLSLEEKKAIYYFIKCKLIGSIVWCDLNRKEHPDKHRKITGWLMDIINFYRKFDELSLDEFLEMAK